MELREWICSYLNYFDRLEQEHILGRYCERDEHLLFSNKDSGTGYTVQVSYASNRSILNELIC
jgi:hypothetical protein